MAASAAYMIFLAWRIATAPPLARHGMQTPAPSFAGGFLLGVANPKSYVAIGAVFAGSTLTTGDPTLDAALKTAVLAVMIVVIHAGWLLDGTAFSRVLYDPVTSRIVNVAFAAALLAKIVLALVT
jgi:threonine/homoserine/homoserine lactone efflux protein